MARQRLGADPKRVFQYLFPVLSVKHTEISIMAIMIERWKSSFYEVKLAYRQSAAPNTPILQSLIRGRSLKVLDGYHYAQK